VVLDYGVEGRGWGEILTNLIQKDPSRVGFAQVVLAQDVVEMVTVGRRRGSS
jgi:imidazole glycerol phosphate synthase subunit HisF